MADLTPAGLAHALGGAKRDGRGYRCRCPAHDDHDPSLSIVERGGKVLLKCRAGCAQDAVIDALRQLGLWHEHDPTERDRKGRIVATYSYRDAAGELRYQVVRFEPKDFRQRRPNGSPDAWLWNMEGVEPLPYRLPELLNDPAATVFIPEGEKDVDNLAEIGILATCNHGGAGNWRPEISRWLAGRHVVIPPDNDGPGESHARDVAAKLAGIAASVRVLELPGLLPKGDVSDWIAAGGTADELERLAATAPIVGESAPDAAIDIAPLSLERWLKREIPEPDFLLGELLSTTSRVLLVGPTGRGKTNFLMALGIAVAEGRAFLHWGGCGRPRRVLYLDGEMSCRLARKRLVDAVHRHGGMPATFYFLNREDYHDLPPLNTEGGQKFVDAIIDALGGVDFINFDNVQALLSGNMQEEEPWQQVMPWIRDLTRRAIGQVWAHHTGHDETHSYGTKTREWQLDTVALMEAIERSDADIAFRLTFTKARERTPDNRADFEATLITLTADVWFSERSGTAGRRTGKERLLELLTDAIAKEGHIPPANAHIPPDTPCVTDDLWRRYAEAGTITDDLKPDSFRRTFQRNAEKLVDAGWVGRHKPWVWIVR
jgi:hypothetical protein